MIVKVKPTTSIAYRSATFVTSPQRRNGSSAVLARKHHVCSVLVNADHSLGRRPCARFLLVLLWRSILHRCRRGMRNGHLGSLRNPVVVRWTPIAATSTPGSIALTTTWTSPSGNLTGRDICRSDRLRRAFCGGRRQASLVISVAKVRARCRRRC